MHIFKRYLFYFNAITSLITSVLPFSHRSYVTSITIVIYSGFNSLCEVISRGARDKDNELCQCLIYRMKDNFKAILLTNSDIRTE